MRAPFGHRSEYTEPSLEHGDKLPPEGKVVEKLAHKMTGIR